MEEDGRWQRRRRLDGGCDRRWEGLLRAHGRLNNVCCATVLATYSTSA
jgi:hypothetical protein